MRRVGFVGLIQIDFPIGTVRLSEAGFINWDGDVFRSSDDTFGVVGGVGQLSEGVGEEIPVFDLELLPPGSTSPAELSQPGYQTSPVNFWLAEYDPSTGLIVGEPDLQFSGQIDQTTLEFGADRRLLTMSIVSGTAQLLERSIGNALTSSWHKSIWPGETGHDQATGLGLAIAWGVEGPGARAGGSFGVPGGGGGYFNPDVNWL